MEVKICTICRKEYARGYTVNRKQFAKSKYCSRKCAYSNISQETREKLRAATKRAYQSGRPIGFPKGHPLYTKTLHKFTAEERRAAVEKCKALGISGGKGIKRPSMTGENHPRWKGGYERKLYNNRRRRALKFNAPGSHTLEEWEELKRKYNYMCLCCKQQEPEIVLTEDHIVPLTKGGGDNIENIQPLCQGCNTRKYNNIISFIPVAA